MFLRDVYGQAHVKHLLREYVAQKRLPHALLFTGNEGSGGFPLALAYAQYVNCTNPTPEGDSCGECWSCRMYQQLRHPDFHFHAPYAGTLEEQLKAGEVAPVDRLKQLLQETPYLTQAQWSLQWSKDGSKKIRLPIEAVRDILDDITNARLGDGFRVYLIYLPEMMDEDAANKLLKTLEEPSPYTLFLLVSLRPELLLPTIRSRVQEIFVPPLTPEDLSSAFAHEGIISPQVESAVRIAQGSYIVARSLILHHETPYLSWLQQLLRLAYLRDYESMLGWADNMAKMGREEQRQILYYFAQMIREMFIIHLGREDLTLILGEELEFARKVSPFVDGANIGKFLQQYTEAYKQVNDNCNMTIVYTDLAIRHAKLIKKPKK